MLIEFFEWWGSQLLDLVPRRYLPGAGRGPDAFIVDASQGIAGPFPLLRRRAGVEAGLGSLAPEDGGRLRALRQGGARDEKVLLRLPAGLVLERPVTLPIAAERDPERVLGFEMERLTPFAPSEMFWAWRIAERDRLRGRLHLRLTLVPRAALAPLLERLAEAGARPDLLEAPIAGEPHQIIRLSHEPDGIDRELWSRRLGVAAVAALALIALISPFLRQSWALQSAQDRLAALAPRLTEVQVLRQRISGAGAGADVLATEFHRLGDGLQGMAALTQIVGDDSYLTEFTMRERQMTLSGLSASAPKLISALSVDPRIRNPSFTAPVTRTDNGRSDVFALRAELAR